MIYLGEVSHAHHDEHTEEHAEGHGEAVAAHA
jgi:hypothetical protein